MWWHRILMIVLSPLVIAFAVIVFICILPKHIKENGFRRFWPRRKGKAYPLDKSDFNYWSKDTVYDGEKDKMTLSEFIKNIIKL